MLYGTEFLLMQYFLKCCNIDIHKIIVKCTSHATFATPTLLSGSFIIQEVHKRSAVLEHTVSSGRKLAKNLKDLLILPKLFPY